jgi:hypothetical protein
LKNNFSNQPQMNANKREYFIDITQHVGPDLVSGRARPRAFLGKPSSANPANPANPAATANPGATAISISVTTKPTFK